MAFKLAIGNQVGVKVEATYRDDSGRDKSCNFTLVCDRLSAEEMHAAIANKDETVETFFERHAKDWRGQALVLDDEDKPAPFSTDALKVLFSIQGMAVTCWRAYLKQAQVAEKN